MSKMEMFVDGKSVNFTIKHELVARRSWYPRILVRLFPKRLGLWLPYAVLADPPPAGSQVVATYEINLHE